MPRCDKHGVKIGWAQVDITPQDSVIIGGQFHARVSEGVKDPLKAVALAIGSSDSQEQVVMVTCDLATISNELRDMVRQRISANGQAPLPENICIGATHTHAAPDPRLLPYGFKDVSEAVPYWKRLLGSYYTDDQPKYGVWPDIGLDVMPPADYLEFSADRIAEAIRLAWASRQQAGIGYGLGHAVVARNRRLIYQDDSAKMYGKADVPEFGYVEGFEDHCVYVMTTHNPDGNLTGMIVNVPCPAQVDESIFQISADFWHETRDELRKRFGSDIHILAQCAPAGDLSPHVLIGRRAEERMWRLKGCDTSQNAPRAEIARKIADAVSDVIPHAQKQIEWAAQFKHTVKTLELPYRSISQQDVQNAIEESIPCKEQFATLMAEIAKHPEIRQKPRWYMDVTRAYRKMERGERVKKRLQRNDQTHATPIHVIRLGEIAFASSPFELYTDYAVRIRERSQAVQTFLVQKAGCSGTYLPSGRSIGHKGYGSVPASTDIGPEGGEMLVERTLSTIDELFET